MVPQGEQNPATVKPPLALKDNEEEYTAAVFISCLHVFFLFFFLKTIFSSYLVIVPKSTFPPK